MTHVVVPSDLSDRFFAVCTMSDVNSPDMDVLKNKLLRVNLDPFIRFPGSGNIHIRDWTDDRKTCLSGDCVDPRCRYGHGIFQDAKARFEYLKLKNRAWRPFYDELHYFTRRSRKLKGNGDHVPRDVAVSALGKFFKGDALEILSFKYTTMNQRLVRREISDELAMGGASMIRDMLRQQSFARKILPPRQIDHPEGVVQFSDTYVEDDTLYAVASIELPAPMEYITVNLHIEPESDTD